jgi:hypothetical protein
VYSIQPADSIEAFRKQLHQYFDAHTSNLSSFSQPSIDWLLSKHQRQSLVDFYLQLYFKLVDYNRCIQLLDLLRINGLKSDLTIDFQQLLGKAMADSSTLEPDAVAVESYLDSIVPDKVWFASYRKAFLAKKIPVVQQIKNKISDFNAKGG